MGQVVAGFYGEGVSDYHFLGKLCERLLTELLPTEDIYPIILIERGIGTHEQVEKILSAAEQARGFHLLFIHADADDSTTERAYKERILPGYQAAQKEPKRYVQTWSFVIPIRNQEAWLLVDFEAFQSATRTKITREELEFPAKPRLAESESDPKGKLNAILRQAYPKRKEINFIEECKALAERVRFSELRQLSAFQEFEQDLREKLRGLGHDPI